MKPILGVALVLAALSAAPTTRAQDAEYSMLRWQDLDGWADDDLAVALEVFTETCDLIDQDGWDGICNLAKNQPDARSFFELLFLPVMVEDGNAPLFTAYYEPELNGSRTQSGAYQYPLYRLPPEAGGEWLTRQEIETTQVLAERGLEICWLDDPVDAYFLHIQGSGRIRLTDGEVIRLGYAGNNGHPYRSVGQEMVRQELLEPHQVSAAVIRNWVRRNPEDGRSILQHNPSFVFFTELDVPAEKGPIGAMARSITTLRSLAVDQDYTFLGAPIWLEKDGEEPMRRLMVAQDTGGAIRGAQRADIFFGSGQDAGDAAAHIRDGGRMIMLLPIQQAYALVPEGA